MRLRLPFGGNLVSRLAHRAFFLDDEEKDRAVALMRRVEAGVQVSMSYCINRAVSISSDPFACCVLSCRRTNPSGFFTRRFLKPAVEECAVIVLPLWYSGIGAVDFGYRF